MDRHMDGWMDRWMDEWMDRWMKRIIKSKKNGLTNNMFGEGVTNNNYRSS